MVISTRSTPAASGTAAALVWKSKYASATGVPRRWHDTNSGVAAATKPGRFHTPVSSSVPAVVGTAVVARVVAAVGRVWPLVFVLLRVTGVAPLPW